MDGAAAFLNARLDEREHFAKTARLAQKHRGQMLREVAAGRAFLALTECYLTEDPAVLVAPWDGESQDRMDEAIRAHLAIWSDHPDYRPEWMAGT